MTVDDFFPFGSAPHAMLFASMTLARATDFVSTWVATPNLVLEANPLARRMGWRLGLLVNLALCLIFAMWALPSVVIITTSLLVAARNFQSAWLMRSLGENEYRMWIGERLSGAARGLFFLCLGAQTALIGVLGGGLMYFSELKLVPFGVGMGIVTYAFAILIYSLLSVWRVRRARG